MANRVGTYLSDENVRARCPEFFPVPMGKSYALFTLADGTPAQRPQNVLQALKEMARNQNRPYQDLERMYANNLALAKNELVVSIPQFSRNTTQAASISMQGNGFVQAQGVPVVAPAVQGTPTGKPKQDYDNVLGEFQVQSNSIQKQIYKELFTLSKMSGADLGTFSASMMDNSMSKKKRVDLFKRLLEQTNAEPSTVDKIIMSKQPSSSYTPLAPTTPIAVSNPFAALTQPEEEETNMV